MIGCTAEGRRYLEKLQDEEMARIEKEEFPYFWEQCTYTDKNNCNGDTSKSATGITLLINNKCDDVINGDMNCSKNKSARTTCDNTPYYENLFDFSTSPHKPQTPLNHKAEALKELRAERNKNRIIP